MVQDEEGEQGALGGVTRGETVVLFLATQVQHTLGTIRDDWAGTCEEALGEGRDYEDHEDLKEVLEGDESWSRDVGFIKVIIISFVISFYSDTLLMIFFALLFLKDRHKHSDSSH